MKVWTFRLTGFALLCFVLQTWGDTPAQFCLVHVESPVYDQLARQTWTQGDVKLKVTIGQNGAVVSVASISGPPLLAERSEQNVRKWTFNEGPERILEVTYEYRLEDPKIYEDPPTKVFFDLPNRVRVVSNFGKPMPSKNQDH